MNHVNEQILAHLLANENKFFSFYETLDGEMFIGIDGEIYFNLKTLLLSGKTLDTMEVADMCSDADVAFDRITELLGGIDYKTNLNTLITIAEKNKNERALKTFSNSLQNSLQENKGNPDKIFAEVNDFVSNYGTGATSDLKSVSDIVDDVFELMMFNSKNDGKLSGIPTGLSKLDYRTNGLQGGDLIIVGGETSQGKTSLALNISNAASDFADVHFITLEMTPNQLIARIMAMESGTNSNTILTSKVEHESILALSENVNHIRSKKLWVDNENSDFDKILASIRKRKIIYDTQLVVIDYLQLIKSNATGNKEQRTADITRTLKNLAIELDIPIILISQLSRDRDNPYPRLARLRDSGQVEEAADIVLFVYRPEFYNKEYFNDGITPSEGMAEIIIAKGRNIGTGYFYTKFDKQLTRFDDYDGF